MRSSLRSRPLRLHQVSRSTGFVLGALLLGVGTAACGGTVSGQAEPTVGVADPKLDTTTPNLPKVGDCTKIDDFVHHGPITVMDCADPTATKKVTVVEIVTDEQKRTVDCLDKEVSLIISGVKDGSLGVAHGCAGQNLAIGRCYVPMVSLFTYDASCTDASSIRLDRTLTGVSELSQCDPSFAADDYSAQIKYITAKVHNFIDKRSGVAYCFREK
ncbi:hypothetical protein AB0H58_18040 [Nocardia neocaledoniensis]|uniref:hypothetical protein n=1 Tax=Nocardia neocaledoniensis TaxID=236511 RepID=UPI0033FCA0A6